jgi:thymidylate synthase
MKYIKGKSFADLYMKVMDQVYLNPEYVTAPRGLKIRECLNVCMEITDPLNNLFKCADKSATLFTKYLKKEICLYLNGTNDVKQFAKASNFWLNIANPDGKTINSAYGNLIFNPSLEDGRSQFDWAFDCLKKDKDSRQAFMRFNNMTHQFEGVKDFPCTFVFLFHIRDNKLYATVEMRSNDIVRGLAYDVPSFTLFQYLMYLRLKPIYPELKIGSYTHISNSLHVYETDFDIIEKRLTNGLTENRFPMPQNWNVIKSKDVEKLIDERLDDTLIDHKWDYNENIDFYDWILS